MKNAKKLMLAAFTALSLSLVCPSVLPFSGVTNVEAAVKISKSKLTLLKGQSKTLEVTGTKKTVKWTSSKKSVATVSDNGKITAKKKGKTTITAKVGKEKYTCVVTIEAPKLSKSKLTVNTGASKTLKMTGTNQKVKWKSSNKKVATVSSIGKVTGKKAGAATITATVSKKKYTCTVTVKKVKNVPVKSFTMSPKTLSLTVGKTSTLKTTIKPSNATNKKIKWKSSNSKVATLSGGKISAVGAGTCTISATCGGITVSCTLTVYTNATEADISKNIDRDNAYTQQGIVSILKNNNTFPVTVEATATFYKDGEMIASSSASTYCLDAGKECALLMPNPETTYTTYSVGIKAGQSQGIGKVVGISYKASKIGNTINVTVTNNSNTTADETPVAVVFYNGEKATGYIEQYAKVPQVGSSDTLTFEVPVDKNNNPIVTNNFKVYVNGSYKR